MKLRKRPLRLVRGAACGCLLGLSFAAGATQAGQTDFQQGLEAARSGDHKQALRYFEQAQEAGFESGALWYNLGVSHYKLGQYSQADNAFRQLTGHPELAPLAWFNIGLVAEKTGDNDRALASFSEARRQTSDENLRQLADRKLAGLKGEKPPEAPAPNRWAGAISLGAGRDDAVQDPAEQFATDTSDNFAELFALGTGYIAGRTGDGWRVDLTAYTVRYSTFDEFDMNVLNGALWRVLPAGEWRLEVGAGAEQSTLGAEAYLREGQLRLGARLPEASGRPGYRIRYRYRAVRSLDRAFDAQEGGRHDLDLEARWIGGAGRLGLIYGLEVNDREDFSAPDLFTSYSPTRHRVSLRADADRGPWRWNGRIEYRYSAYDGANVLADGRRVEREDDRLRGLVGVDYRLSPAWQLGAEYSRIDNDSNIAEYDYDQNLFTAGVTALF